MSDTLDPAWLEDELEERPAPEELAAMYRQYRQEGHLTLLLAIDGDRADGDWIGVCGCGCSGTVDQTTLDYHEAKWWTRGHRTDHGLPWQDWLPFIAGDFRHV